MQKFYNKVSVQVAIVTGFVAIVIAGAQLWFAHSSVKVHNKELVRLNHTLRDDLVKTASEVQRLETLLIPFRTIALERYAGPEGEALRKLVSRITELEADVDTTKRLAEPPFLVLDGVDVTDEDDGIRALIRFTTSTNKRIEQITIGAQRPLGTDARILEFKQVPAADGGLAIMNVRKRIHPEGKAATWQCNPSTAGPAWFALTVSQPTKAQINLNCGPSPFEIAIQTQNN